MEKVTHDGECVRGWGSDPDVCDCEQRAKTALAIEAWVAECQTERGA